MSGFTYEAAQGVRLNVNFSYHDGAKQRDFFGPATFQSSVSYHMMILNGHHIQVIL